MKPIKIRKPSMLIELLLETGLTKTKIRQLLKHRAITVNGKAAGSLDMQLSPNDEVVFDAKHKRGSSLLEQAGIRIVHEDASVMVVEKPSGLLTIATEAEKHETAYYLLNAYFKERDPSRPDRIFIVHRLDRETSGLLVFGKNEAAKNKLQAGWDRAEKKYYAVVEGIPRMSEGRLESHLGETKAFKVYSAPESEDTRHAVTRYRVIRSGNAAALLDIILDTGRKHQIRVHLSDMGCPVVGDKKYGAKTNPIRRIALHAYSISFIHPGSGMKMHFETGLPKSFNALLK